jgi:hypothetical protein
MTREDAIAELSVIWERLSHPEDCENGCYSFRDGDYLEALDMAIEALQDRPTPCEKCIHVKSCRKVIILKNRTYKLIKYCSQGAERREP